MNLVFKFLEVIEYKFIFIHIEMNLFTFYYIYIYMFPYAVEILLCNIVPYNWYLNIYFWGPKVLKFKIGDN